jgi:hypothetical protein
MERVFLVGVRLFRDGRVKLLPVLATWDIRSGNWAYCADGASIFAKVGEIRVQLTRFILRIPSDHTPIFTKKRFHCAVCIFLDQAMHLFSLARAPRTWFALDQTTEDLTCARNVC